MYFTSGTTAQPKFVLHTHQSYPIGHLSTMYWIGIQPGDVHFNISSPGWAKHAWSSVFAPWNAGAAVLSHHSERFSAVATLALLRRAQVSTLCAPPTVWRMLLLGELGPRPLALRECVSAGEPLNPEVIERVRAAWGLTIQGELAVALTPRPVGLMVGYEDDPARTAEVMAGGYYRTGDEATRDAAGHYHYVGRGDDVFKNSDYRISPFELESALLEHPAVAEAAIVPSPDPVRLFVPKAFITLRPGIIPSREMAREVLTFARSRLAPYQRIRRLEFIELPKTISGKIRRVALRLQEQEHARTQQRPATEFRLEELDV